MRGLISQKLSTSENSERVQQLTQKVLVPKKQGAPSRQSITLAGDGVLEASQPPTGHHQVATPEKTDLPDLMIKALARDVLPLQEELRTMQKEMVQTIANELRDLVLGLMKERLNKNVSNAPDLEDVLKSAWGIAQKGLLGVRIVDHFPGGSSRASPRYASRCHRSCERRCKWKTLPARGQKGRLTNEMRRDELGRMTVRNGGLANR